MPKKKMSLLNAVLETLDNLNRELSTHENELLEVFEIIYNLPLLKQCELIEFVKSLQ
jgi:hypothetical protein